MDTQSRWNIEEYLEEVPSYQGRVYFEDRNTQRMRQQIIHIEYKIVESEQHNNSTKLVTERQNATRMTKYYKKQSHYRPGQGLSVPAG